MVTISLCVHISIHAPREGGDHFIQLHVRLQVTFQSTPPARGATPQLSATFINIVDISIHAPREGGDGGL